MTVNHQNKFLKPSPDRYMVVKPEVILGRFESRVSYGRDFNPENPEGRELRIARPGNSRSKFIRDFIIIWSGSRFPICLRTDRSWSKDPRLEVLRWPQLEN